MFPRSGFLSARHSHAGACRIWCTFCRNCTLKVSTCFCISKVSTRPRRPAARCFRCLACSPNLKPPLSANGSWLAWRGQGPTGRGLVDPQPSPTTQPKSERSEPPAVRARVSALLRESTALVSGQSRASPHERRSIAATKGDATDRPPGHRPLAPPEVASENRRNTSRQIFHPAEIAVGQALLERGLPHGGSPRRVSGRRWVRVRHVCVSTIETTRLSRR